MKSPTTTDGKIYLKSIYSNIDYLYGEDYDIYDNDDDVRATNQLCSYITFDDKDFCVVCDFPNCDRWRN